jgi:hypothetical protein
MIYVKIHCALIYANKDRIKKINEHEKNFIIIHPFWDYY